MQLEFWAATNVGRAREHNEDNFLVDKRLQLFVVCDGMGGHAAGEVASAVCVRTVRDVVFAHRDAIEALERDPDNLDHRENILALMERAIHTACRRIYEMAQEDSSRRGMGTTCVMLLISGERAFIGHVGDSRVYVVRDETVSQITTDHSLFNEMIRQGKIKPGDDQDFPHKNAVTRAVGVKESVEVDTMEIELEDGDRFMLCSDGLSGYFLDDDDILDLVQGDDLKELTQRCIRFANEGGGKDNITVVLIDTLLESYASAMREDDGTFIEVLKEMPFFHYLNQTELQQIVSISERHEYERNSLAIGPAETADRLNIVVEGSLSLLLHGRQIGVLVSGDHFGELSFIDEKPEMVTVRALENTVVMSIGRAQFMALLRNDPQLAIKLLWNFLQVFSSKLRQVPYDFLREPDLWWARLADDEENATPPSGRLTFLEDARDVIDDSTSDSNMWESEDATRPISTQVISEISDRNGNHKPGLNTFTGSETPTRKPGHWGSAQTESDEGGAEDLRKTMQIDWGQTSSSLPTGSLQTGRPPALPPVMPPAAAVNVARVNQAAVVDRSPGKAISGTSVVSKSTAPGISSAGSGMREPTHLRDAYDYGATVPDSVIELPDDMIMDASQDDETISRDRLSSPINRSKRKENE